MGHTRQDPKTFWETTRTNGYEFLISSIVIFIIYILIVVFTYQHEGWRIAIFIEQWLSKYIRPRDEMNVTQKVSPGLPRL